MTCYSTELEVICVHRKENNTHNGGKIMWNTGTIKIGKSIFHYWVKHYEEGSRFGIDEGCISKLMLKRNGEIVCSYDREWDIEPADADTETALAILMKDYN